MRLLKIPRATSKTQHGQTNKEEPSTSQICTTELQNAINNFERSKFVCVCAESGLIGKEFASPCRGLGTRSPQAKGVKVQWPH